MAGTFIIPKTAYAGFDALIGIGGKNLKQLADVIDGQRLTLDTAGLAARIGEQIKTDPARLELAFDRVLIPLSGVRAELRMPAKPFVRLLTDLIQEQGKGWLDANRDRWERVVPAVELLVGPGNLFEQLNKAYRLIAERPALVEGVRVLTELRPVYDDDVAAVHAYLITSTLAVSYQEFGQQKQVHLTMDRADLLRLREQVERGLKKIQLLERQVARLEVPALVAGSES